MSTVRVEAPKEYTLRELTLADVVLLDLACGSAKEGEETLVATGGVWYKVWPVGVLGRKAAPDVR